MGYCTERYTGVSGAQELFDTFIVDLDEGDTITAVERGEALFGKLSVSVFLSLSLIFGKKK